MLLISNDDLCPVADQAKYHRRKCRPETREGISNKDKYGRRTAFVCETTTPAITISTAA